MFAAPRPILPGEPEDSKPVPKEKQVSSQNVAASENTGPAVALHTCQEMVTISKLLTTVKHLVTHFHR